MAIANYARSYVRSYEALMPDGLLSSCRLPFDRRDGPRVIRPAEGLTRTLRDRVREEVLPGGREFGFENRDPLGDGLAIGWKGDGDGTCHGAIVAASGGGKQPRQ